MKIATFISALFGLTVMAASARLSAADSAPRQTLDAAQLQFQRSLIESSLAPLKKHLLELTALEKKLAETHDYRTAISVRDQRRRVEGDLERMDKELLLMQTREQSLKAALLPDRITLPLDKAVLSGVQFSSGALTGWNRAGASAEWKLPGLPPGGYEVILRYRCGALDGGVVQVQEAKFSLKNQVDTTLKGPQEKNLGTIKITDGS
ncbi:MAG: hypothetical protein NTV80_09610, partial [Verrucomicrobia bacterium]|nr:hypothetical protein [Verrucomicrobiota bacterium]